MPIIDMLGVYYAIQAERKLELDGKDGYKQDEYVYFTISADNREIIHMEQATLAYYLIENKYNNTALPIPNRNGEWFTAYEDKNYMVMQVQRDILENTYSSGESLAHFHQIGTAYSYEPKTISSYGQWKQLWIDKLTAFESNVELEAKNHSSNYYRLLMDVLPYIVGISENGIQYIQESEHERRYHEADQGTIAFRRYTNDLEKTVLWADELVYDHPTRDLAECIRFMILNNKDDNELITFLNDYQSLRPLSVFSWRLLYARLIFPIHFFDIIDRGFMFQDLEQSYSELRDILKKQVIYEKRLGELFKNLGVDHEVLQIPVLDWL
ncbi:hypothetical protein CIL05_15795 [Virgibacillus profundi]|uniref:Spore coat protein YutH n=1 Tax=Virgibacillus profundi TaxID=2024555 RepID=A0A2A2IC85_9BACI|nr:hypothetical protein [Virgibacillus profundi]PAV28740.1 hypothetical protein CIL05_15795 [Virgibacillus profundi]PXY52908.1 hypothetical protein CIT14_15930 [Virgibacillus profundi]